MGMSQTFFFKGLQKNQTKVIVPWAHDKAIVTQASNICKIAPVDEKVSISCLKIHFHVKMDERR